jgi:hypothetical protein
MYSTYVLLQAMCIMRFPDAVSIPHTTRRYIKKQSTLPFWQAESLVLTLLHTIRSTQTRTQAHTYHMTKKTVDRARAAQELGIAQSLLETFTRKADQLAQQQTGGPDGSPNTFRLEPAERDKLMEINNTGLVEGMVAGIISLVALRRIRGSLLRRLYAAREASPPPPHSHAPPPHHGAGSTGGSPFHQQNSPFAQTNSPFHTPQQHAPPPPFSTPPPPHASNKPKEGTFAFLFGWALDAVGAFAVMASVSFMLTDVNKILNTLSDIPLTEGRSTIAREFCPDVVQALQQLRQNDPAAAAVLDDAQTRRLQAVRLFIHNCQRREAYEAALRREKGVADPHYPVQVPAGGVPPDFPLPPMGSSSPSSPSSSSSSTYDDSIITTGEDDFDFYEPTSDPATEAAWADELTTDRDEDDARRR